MNDEIISLAVILPISKNYKEEIKDGELVCTDLIYYSKDLKEKRS